MIRSGVHVLVAVLCACLAPRAFAQGHGDSVRVAADAPLFDNLGDHHRTISTYLPQAQRYFDQGLRLMFAFNLEEAERSFRAAVAIDPTCAICSWGVALRPRAAYQLPGDAGAHRAVAAAIAEAKARAAPERPPSSAP